MFTEIKIILSRSRATLVEDMMGGAALFVLLFVGLGWAGTV